MLHLVVLRRAGAMSIDIIDLVGLQAGILQRVMDAADDRLAVGARAGAMEGIGHLAATFEDAENFGATGLRGLVALEHESAGALGHDEAVAILGERLGRGLP